MKRKWYLLIDLFRRGRIYLVWSRHRYPDRHDVRHYGARGDGVHDCSADIQRALDSVEDVNFPPGEFCLSRTLDLTRGSGGLHGSGFGKTVFRWIRTPNG